VTKPVPLLDELVQMEKWSAVDSENAAIGAVLLDAESLAPSFCGMIADADLFNPDNRLVVEVIRRMIDANEPLDLTTIARRLLTGDKPAKHIMLSKYLNAACPSASLRFHCQEILDASAVRAMLQAMYSGMGADLDISEMRERLLQAADIAKARGPGVRTAFVAASDEVANVEARRADGAKVNGIPTGWPGFNGMTGGLTPSEVTLVAARPSVGKTAMGVQLALDVAQQGHRVLFVSLEMSETALMHRMLANLSGIESKSIRCSLMSDIEMDYLRDARDQLNGIPIDLVDKAGLRMRDIHALAKRLPEHGGVVIVDYIGLIKPDDAKIPREQQVSRISAAIKAAAKDTRIPWVVLSQLRRLNPDRKSNPEPTLQDLRESGSLEQDADTVILLHREDYGAKDAPRVSPLQAIIAKQRNGPTGVLHLAFDRVTQRIVQDK